MVKSLVSTARLRPELPPIAHQQSGTGLNYHHVDLSYPVFALGCPGIRLRYRNIGLGYPRVRPP